MKGRKLTPEQIVRKLREADRLFGEGKQLAEVAKELGISEHTSGRWRNQCGGIKADDAKELRPLKDKNGRLKRMVADHALDIEMLKEVAAVVLSAARGLEGLAAIRLSIAHGLLRREGLSCSGGLLLKTAL